MPDMSSTDSNFERTFADLAYARLRDKAPSLLDHLIGFQMIDKNEEETHAIGVFGFKVGDEWVYAPVFFINGELKGHELMYVKSQDAFVPLVEAWTNYILNRRPQVLGRDEPKPRGYLGLRQPDFDVFARTPYIGSKYASAQHPAYAAEHPWDRLEGWAKDSFHMFAESPNGPKYRELDGRFDLPGALSVLGKRAAVNLIATMRKDEAFADSVLSFYSVEDLMKAAADKPVKPKEVGSTEPLDASEPADAGLKADAIMQKDKTSDRYRTTGTAPKVVVITRGDDASRLTHHMTEDDKRKLLKDRYVVKDERKADQKSRLYKTQLGVKYQSPSSNGLYEVLTSKGEALTLLVITSPINVGSQGKWPTGKCVVLDPQGKRYGNYQTRDLLVNRRLEAGEWGELFRSKAFSSPKSLAVGDVCALVGPTGTGTPVFEVTKQWTNRDGQTELQVSPRAYCSSDSHGGGFVSQPNHSIYTASVHDAEKDVLLDTIIMTGKSGEQATQMGNTLFIPDGFKALKVTKEPKYSFGDAGIELGSMPDVMLKLWKSAEMPGGAHRLQLITDGIRFTPVLDDKHGPALTKVAAIKHLIVNQGLDQADAEFLVKEAQPRVGKTYFIKYALDDMPMSPYFPEPVQGNEYGIPVPAQYPLTQFQRLGQIDTSGNRDLYRDYRYIDEGAKRYAGSAAAQGQKEVLDTAVISGLVKTMDPDSSVDNYIGDLLLGLDRLGRILFMYYWHNEKFKDRYGQQDMVELEDNLRNVFKSLGELTLFLKQKTVEPDSQTSPEAELSDVLS